MGLTQTKLHHRVLQENWPAICRRLQTEEGKKWVRTQNPCGDAPLHLACYGGHAPPIIVRALVAAYPEALHLKNNLGYKPMDLARSNYREGHPFREEVLEYLEAYSVDVVDARDDADVVSDGATEDTTASCSQQQQQRIVSISDHGAELPDITFTTSTTCVVCLERKADHVVVPCGHLCLCGDCAKKIIERSQKGRGNRSSNNNNNTTVKTTTAQSYCPVGRCAFTSIAKVPSQCIAVT